MNDTRSPLLLLRATIAALMVGALGLGIFALRGKETSVVLSQSETTVPQVGAGDEAAFKPLPSTVPTGFRAESSESVHIPVLDSVDSRTKVTVVDDVAGRLLLVTGSHDALESLIPEMPYEEVRAEPDYSVVQRGEWRYLFQRPADDPHIRALVFAHRPVLKLFDSAAVSLIQGKNASKIVAEGDISALTSAAAANAYNFVSSDGKTIAIQTFPSESLDPILGYLEPMSERTNIGGQLAYRLVSESGMQIVASTAPTGELVITAATRDAVDMSALERIAANLERGK